MRTGRSLTVCRGVPAGGVPASGGVPAPGEAGPGGGIPACTEADPPCEQNHRHE